MPFLRASARVIWFTAWMGSVISSTTTIAWKSSTTPLSGSYLASRLRSWPKCFLAAVFIASSRVAMSTPLSMPLSLATWSRTRFRLMLGFAGVGMVFSERVHGPAPRGTYPVCQRLELELQVGLGDVLEGDAETARALHLDRDLLAGHLSKHAGEVLAGRVADGAVGLHLHLLPLHPLIMSQLLQWPVHPGAGDLEVVL